MATDASETAVQRVQRLFLMHSDLLRGFIRALLPDKSIAEDVLQETFLVITKKAEQVQEGSNFRAWACTIARNKVLETIRKLGRRETLLSAEVIESLAVAEEAYEEDPRAETLRLCIEKLAPKARQAVSLRYENDMKPAEIARTMGWKAEAVYVALSRARSLLRECIEKKSGPAAELL